MAMCDQGRCGWVVVGLDQLAVDETIWFVLHVEQFLMKATSLLVEWATRSGYSIAEV